METRPTRPTGMLAFTFVWIGQIVSILATQMTQFALTIWVFETTHSVTALGLMQVFFITPFLLISPLAGAMVDRYDRKLMMMVSDLGAGLATVSLLILQAAGVLQVWHLYVAALVTGTFNAFQWPAYSASISLMVPKEQYGRANGMVSLMEMGPGVLAPLLAGALLGLIHLTGIMLIDVVTFILAILVLAAVHVPNPARTAEGKAGQGSIWRESIYGFGYILRRPSLLGLQIVFLLGNLFFGIAMTVVAPLILTRTNNNEVIYGTVMSVGAIGGVVGGIVMSAWGGFKHRVHGVLLGWLVSSLLGFVLFGLSHTLVLWSVASFMGAFFGPLINGSNQAIWQAKVAPDVQGRVFAARRLIAWLTNPITPVIAGVLADRVLEPAMLAGGGLTRSFSWLVGSGPGSGMALLIVAMGVLAASVGAGAYLVPAIRDAESRLPDHDAAVAGARPAAVAAD